MVNNYYCVVLNCGSVGITVVSMVVGRCMSECEGYAGCRRSKPVQR